MSQKPKIFYTCSWWESMTPIDLHAHKYRAIEEFGEDNVVAVEIAQPSKGTNTCVGCNKPSSLALCDECEEIWQKKRKSKGMVEKESCCNNSSGNHIIATSCIPTPKEGSSRKCLECGISLGVGWLPSHCAKCRAKEGSSADEFEPCIFCGGKTGQWLGGGIACTVSSCQKMQPIGNAKLSAKPEMVKLDEKDIQAIDEALEDYREWVEYGSKFRSFLKEFDKEDPDKHKYCPRQEAVDEGYRQYFSLKRLCSKFSAPLSRVPSLEEIEDVVAFKMSQMAMGNEPDQLDCKRSVVIAEAVRELLLRGEK